MEICKCAIDVKRALGNRWVTVDGERLRKCNNCDLLANDDNQLKEIKEIEKPSTPMGKRLAGIDEIVKRMWIWISIQALFIGVWFGNAFAETKVNTDYWGDTSVSQEFNAGMFLMGILIGFGSFAPLVFVVQALREVVLNIVKGPIDESELS